jgi:tyrosine-protein phosphatase SIW14
MRAVCVRTAVLLALAIPAAAQPAQQTRPSVRIENFGQINESYYRGAQPKASDYADLAKIGVKTVIDLTRDGKADEPQAVAAAGMHFVRIPMTTTDRPDPSAVDRFLKLVNEPVNQPVFVHCQGGRHRTGVMTALYRVTHDGWTADRAFEEMKAYEFEKGFVSHGILKTFLFDFSRLIAHRSVE